MKKLLITCIIGLSAVTKAFSQQTTLNDIAYSKLAQTYSYPISCIIMGDTGPGKDVNEDHLCEDWIELMNQISATNFPNKVEFIVIVGDLMDKGTNDEYTTVYNKIKNFMNLSSGVPIISVPGNHEFVELGSYDRFNQYIGNYDDYFDILDWRFVYVNNVLKQDAASQNNPTFSITQTQRDWLNNVALSSTTNCPNNVINLAHVALFRTMTTVSSIDYPGYNEYYDLLVSKGCKVHYGGHYHDYMRRYDCADDFFCITTGGGGSHLGQGTPRQDGMYVDNLTPLFGEYKFHFLYLTMYSDGSLKTQVYLKDEGHSIVASQGDFWIPNQNYSNSVNVQGSDSAVKNYFAKQTITVAENSTYTATSGSNINMVVDKGGTITINSGFEVELGASLQISIQNFDCENLSQ